jgi:hypothetical protein
MGGKMAKTHAAHNKSFHQRLVEYENERHARRLAEIKKAEAKLRLFEPTVAALEQRGIRLALNVHLIDQSTGSLRLKAAGFLESEPRLYDALLELGYKEEKRCEHTTLATCWMKQGRLRVYLWIPRGHPHRVPGAPT